MNSIELGTLEYTSLEELVDIFEDTRFMIEYEFSDLLSDDDGLSFKHNNAKLKVNFVYEYE